MTHICDKLNIIRKHDIRNIFYARAYDIIRYTGTTLDLIRGYCNAADDHVFLNALSYSILWYCPNNRDEIPTKERTILNNIHAYIKCIEVMNEEYYEECLNKFVVNINELIIDILNNKYSKYNAKIYFY